MIWVRELINGVVVDVQGNLTADPAGSVYLLLRRPDAPPSPGPDPGPTPGPNPPLPDTIVVSAPYEWYDGAYTEDGAPGIGAYLWGSRETSITPNEGESEDEAKLRFSLGVVTDAVRRDYIVSPAGYVYWRDVEKYGIYSYTAVPVYRAPLYGSANDPNRNEQNTLYTEGRSEYESVGRVFKDALANYDEWSITDDEILRYSTDALMVADNPQWETDAESFTEKAKLCYIRRGTRGDGSPYYGTVALFSVTDPDTGTADNQLSFRHEAIYATGESVTLTGKHQFPAIDENGNPQLTFTVTYVEVTTYDHKYTFWVGSESYGDSFPGTPGKPYLERESDEYDEWDVIKPDYDWWIDGVTTVYPAWYYSCDSGWLALGNSQGNSFLVNGKPYFVPRVPDVSVVFDVTPCYAWSLSPCFKGVAGVPETIYTQEEHPVSGSEFGLWDATTRTFTPTDFVAGSGEGIYSLKGEKNSAISNYFSTLKWQI